MAENENGQSSNEQKTAPAHPAVKKVAVVKRIKVPVQQPVSPQPAAPAPKAQDAPAAPQAAPAAEPAPAASEASSSEPALPPEDKSKIVSSPIEAEEIEKEPPRKRRRRAAVSEPQPDPRAEKINEMKGKAFEIMKKRVFRLGVAAFVGLCILFGIYSWLPTLAEAKLPELMQANGVGMGAFKVKTLTMDTLELTGVRDKTGTVTVSNVKATYSFLGLLVSRHIKNVTLSGVTITGEKTKEGISLGALTDMITAPMRPAGDHDMVIDSLSISGNFVLNEELPEEEAAPAPEPEMAEGENPENNGEEEEPEEPEGPLTVNFSANGSWKAAGINLNITTGVENKQLTLNAQSSFFKSPASSEVKAEITEGNVKENGETVGSVTGTFEFSAQNGAVQKGGADLTVATPVQDLSLKAEVLPSEKEGFDLDIQLTRSFKEAKDGFGKFAGDLKIKAEGLHMSGNFQKFSGNLPLTVEASSLSNGRLSMTNMKTTADVAFSCDDGTCTYSLSKPLKSEIASFAYTGHFSQFRTYEPLALGVNPAKEPFLTAKAGELSFRLPLVGFVAKAIVSDRAGSMQTVAAFNGAKAVVNYNMFTGAYAGRMVFAQSGYADKNVKLTNVQGDVSFDHRNLPALNIKVGTASLVQQGILPVMAADLKLKPMRGGEYGVDLALRTQNGLVSATAHGSYVLSSKEWSLLIDVPEQKFADGGLKLSEILPAVAAKFKKEPTGGLALKGRLIVRDGKAMGPVNLLLRDVSAQWGEIGVEHVNGVLEINSLYPFETAQNQKLFVGTLGLGVPFKNALFNFKVSPTAGVQVDSLQMSYADGQFKNVKSFTVPYEGTPSSIYLEGRGINLEAFSKNLKAPYLKMEGIVDSDWKLSLKDGAVTADNVRFQTKIPGLLEFDTPSTVKLKMDKKMQAFLKNVIVKDLLFAMKGPMNGLLNFKLGISGRSPLDTTEENKEMSLQFTGGLKEFLNQDGGSFEIPSDIRLSLQNYYK